MILTLEPTKWCDAIESTPECLLSSESAKNVEQVLSKTSTRKHQKLLMKAVEPFLEKMLKDRAGLSILTSLVKYGTTATVNDVSKALLHTEEGLLMRESTTVESCGVPLGSLVERVIYREDCIHEHRINIINLLRSSNYPLLVENAILLPAAARLVLLEADFASSFCSDFGVETAFLHVCCVPSKRRFLTEFCNTVLTDVNSKNIELKSLCSRFIFNALKGLYVKDSSLRPPTKVTCLLAMHGGEAVIYDLASCMALWPDLAAYSQNEEHTKVIALILERLQDTKIGLIILRHVFRSKNDIDDRLTSRKASHLHLLAAVAEKPVYIAALTKICGESQEKKLLGAAVRYRSTTKPKSLATKETILQKIEQMRGNAMASNNTSKKCKRHRE